MCRPRRWADVLTAAMLACWPHACSGCSLLPPGGLGSQLKLHSHLDDGAWTASLILGMWEEGALVTLHGAPPMSFDQVAFAELQSSATGAVTFRLNSRFGGNPMLVVHGKGGCFAEEHPVVACVVEVTCEHAPSPTPPPSPLPSPPPPTAPDLVFASPRVAKEGCHSVQLAWDAPRLVSDSGVDAQPASYEYRILVNGSDGWQPAGPWSHDRVAWVSGLAPGATYVTRVALRRREEIEWRTSPMLTYTSPQEYVAPDLTLGIGVSEDSCDTLELTLPTIAPSPCFTKDFLSVEWRVAQQDVPWESFVDRIDAGDYRDNTLEVDGLSAYEAYEFRVMLHQVDHGSEAGSTHGHVLTGPESGAVLAGMRENELLEAPAVVALTSASVQVVLPDTSSCRTGAKTSIWFARGRSSAWSRLPEDGITRRGRTIVARTLRCVDGCRFRYFTLNVKGWNRPSAESQVVFSPRLPAVGDGRLRYELKLGAHLNGRAKTFWSQQFVTDLGSAVGVEQKSILVVETRGDGEHVIFDLPASDVGEVASLGLIDAAERATGESPETPATRLAGLMALPACSTNLALGQPGSCSSSCGNGTSPKKVNDGDLRQYFPHEWLACENDKRPWWSVRLPESLSRPFVRVLMGDCCAIETRRMVEVHIGPESGPSALGKCADLVVDDGSASGVVCEGEGEWVTIVALGPIALAEVQVCDTAPGLQPLFARPALGAIDTAAGLVRIDGTQLTQEAPELLSLTEPGRNAMWRVAGLGGDDATALDLMIERLMQPLIAGLGGLVALSLLACGAYAACGSSRRKPSKRANGGPRFTRATPSEKDEKLPSLGGMFGDDDESDEEEGAFVAMGAMPVSFERSDGTTIASRVSIDGVGSMAQLMANVRAAATDALKFDVEHVSLQYLNARTQVTEQAWYDPVLGEGSDLRLVTQARHWRVLVLGGGQPAATSRM